MSTTPSTPTTEAPAEQNSVARLFGALFNPKPTFDSIARRPTWILPILLGCVAFIGVVAAFSYRGGWESFMEKQDASSSRIQNMTPEARENLIKTQVKVAPIFGYVEGVIVPFTSALAVAGVLLGAFTVTGSTKTISRRRWGLSLTRVCRGWCKDC